MHTHLTRLLIILILMLAGCGGGDTDSGPLPTIAQQALQTPASSIPMAADAETTGEAVAVAPAPTDIPATTEQRATLPPTWTASPTNTEVPTITVTPSNTITVTPSLTPTPTITETLEPNSLLDLALTAAVSTPVPSQFVQPGPTLTIMPPSTFATPIPTQASGTACQYTAPGGFGTALAANPSLSTQIGCASGVPPATSTLNAATQQYERGSMLWVADAPGVIYVFYDDGTFQRFDDTFVAGTDPDSGGEAPPPGLIEPVRGFGKVWRTNPGVRDRLGWATTGETGGTSITLAFSSGRMIAASSRGDILALIYTTSPTNGAWQSVPGSF